MKTNDPYLSDEDFQFIADDIGPNLLKFITLDKVKSQYGEKGLREVPLIQSIEQMVKQENFQLGELHNRQRTLLQQIRFKFSDVPKNVISRIEQTDDIEQLDRWLLQILVVESWQEMGF